MKQIIEKMLGVLGLNDDQAPQTASTRRRRQRQPGQGSLLVVGETTFPIEDWSQDGVLIGANNSVGLAIGDTFNFTLKFKLPHDTIAIKHQGRVVRTSRQGIAAEFSPMTAAVKREFGRVMDGFYSQNFVESQSVA